MKIKILHEDAILPTKAHSTDAGFDLCSIEKVHVSHGIICVVRTGIAVEIPDNHVGIIKDRSSVALQGLHIIAGVIDSGYRGELKVIITNLSSEFGDREVYKIEKGQKIAQLLILPLANISSIHITKELSNSDREEKGFGSSDL